MWGSRKTDRNRWDSVLVHEPGALILIQLFRMQSHWATSILPSLTHTSSPGYLKAKTWFLRKGTGVSNITASPAPPSPFLILPALPLTFYAQSEHPDRLPLPCPLFPGSGLTLCFLAFPRNTIPIFPAWAPRTTPVTGNFPYSDATTPCYFFSLALNPDGCVPFTYLQVCMSFLRPETSNS